MAESLLKNSIGLIVLAIKGISSLIEEFNLRNENVLSLHREILQLRPSLENLQRNGTDNSGVHNRIQRMIILLEEIKLWMEMFASKSTLSHFFCALVHKKEINRFYIRIQELKMEMGFEMKVDAHVYQAKLVKQMQELLDSLRVNVDFERINTLLEYQRRVYEMKLENHLDIMHDIDVKYSRLVGDYECELDIMKQKTETMQMQIDMMETRLHELHEKVVTIESLRKGIEAKGNQIPELKSECLSPETKMCKPVLRSPLKSTIDKIYSDSDSSTCLPAKACGAKTILTHEEIKVQVDRAVETMLVDLHNQIDLKISNSVEKKVTGMLVARYLGCDRCNNKMPLQVAESVARRKCNTSKKDVDAVAPVMSLACSQYSTAAITEDVEETNKETDTDRGGQVEMRSTAVQTVFYDLQGNHRSGEDGSLENKVKTINTIGVAEEDGSHRGQLFCSFGVILMSLSALASMANTTQVAHRSL